MRLADFILANREPILVEWEAFARTLGKASIGMDIAALRDHASEMLTAIAEDLATPQGGREQAEKSKGQAPDETGGSITAAQEHGAERAESGFSVEEIVSEYRALRASVIRLWTKEQDALAESDLEDLTRFNEAIDQSLAESVTRYASDLNASKDMFLAILGHDLRTPLGAIVMSSQFMLETQDLKEPILSMTSRIASSSTRMNRMIGDLLDFTRSRLGSGIPIVRADDNMERVARDVVDEIVSAHPERAIEIVSNGPQQGHWDCPRISQALSNLIGNALEHGSAGTPVKVTLGGDDESVFVAIHNRGATIPAGHLNGLFDPMKRQEAKKGGGSGPTANLGLGLYIADRIVVAHQGWIGVTSTDTDGTTFTVHLPRKEKELPEMEERGRRDAGKRE